MVLHALLYEMAAWGAGPLKRLPDRPDAIGAGANAGKPEGESGERRMIVRLITDIASKPAAETNAHLLEPALVSPIMQITGPDALPLPPLLIQEDGEPVQATYAEMMARTKLAGVYESQIRAPHQAGLDAA
jgi:hypothetical protein